MTKKKVLIVDDSVLVLEIYKDLLEFHGFDVITRNTPFGTASIITSEKPDVILVDMFMPGLSGDKIVEIIRQNKSCQDIILLLFSDRPVGELQTVATTCGAHGFLRKTKNHMEFIERVKSYIPVLS